MIKEKSGKWKRAMLLSLFVLLATTALLAGTVTAVTHTEVESVTRTIEPDVVDSEAEFEVTLAISPDAELPLVVGIAETIPEGFSFVSTTYPFWDQSESNPRVISFTVIAKTETEISEIKYTVQAPSLGRGVFEGEFVDLLVLSPELGEGKERWKTIEGETMIRVRDVGEGAGAIEEGVTATPTPTPYVPAVTKASRSFPVMEAGKEVATTFKDMDVSMIALKADKDVNDVKVVIERVERTPDMPEPSGVSYAYLDMEVENAGDAKIEGRVEFKVANSWIVDNNIDEATVTLNRYDKDEGWVVLATSKTDEDADFAYFEAETPGFSTFAVTGEKKVVVEAAAAAATPTPTTAVAAPTPAATATPSPTPPSSEEVPGFEAIFAAVALVIVYTTVFRKGKKGGDVE